MFGISRQGIYQSEERRQIRDNELTHLRPLILKIRRRLPKLGGRKLYYLLKPEINELGIKIGRDAFFTYLRNEQLLIPKGKRYVQTTNSKHWLRKHPNLLKGLKIERQEQVFVSDITYLKTRERTHYLSLVTDAFSRKIMGYHLSDDMSTDQVIEAIKMAIRNRITKAKLIHHSDRGLQYCSKPYQELLKKADIRPSMTDGYDCYQNALAERMNGILKQEFLFNKCNTKQELETMIQQSIETYNSYRPHLSLNMRTPELIHKSGSDPRVRTTHYL